MNNYLIIIGSIVILIYFAYTASTFNEWFNNVLDIINILPLPDILKKIIFYIEFSIKLILLMS